MNATTNEINRIAKEFAEEIEKEKKIIDVQKNAETQAFESKEEPILEPELKPKIIINKIHLSESVKNHINLEIANRVYRYQDSIEIDKKIDARVTMILQDKLDEIKEGLMEDFNESARKLFSKMDFIKEFKRRMINLVEQEIKTSMSRNHLESILGEKIQQITKDNLAEFVKIITETMVKEINNKLTKEYQTAKDLTYSIDAEIRHCLMELPISKGTEELVKGRIMEMIDKSTISLHKKLAQNLKTIEHK
jgi:hypothetical protein